MLVVQLGVFSKKSLKNKKVDQLTDKHLGDKTR
jgi:hypothetical protein